MGMTAIGTMDPDAIHDDVSNEIAGITEKAVPVAADLLVIEDSADANAKKRVQIGNLPGGGGGGLGFALPVITPSWNPSDSQTVYFGALVRSPSTNPGYARVYIPKAGTIKAAHIIATSSGAAGSAEAWPLYIELNGGANTLIASVSLSAVFRYWSNAALSIAVNAGDYIEIVSVHPAWATNPTGCYFGGSVYLG